MNIFKKYKEKKYKEKMDKKLLKTFDDYNKMQDKLLEAIENSPFAKQVFEQDLQTYGQIFKNQDEYYPYVKKDKELTEYAISQGDDAYLWNTNMMAQKLKRHFQETSDAPSDYIRYASYLAVMPKFVESDQITDIFTRFYYKNEIDYNEKIFDKTIFEIATTRLAPPLMGVFEYYLKKTHDVPYPSYIKAIGLCPYYVNPHINDLKPSENGLSLVPCSHYEFNEITGNHFQNLSREEQKQIIVKQNEEIDKRLKEKGLI